MRAFLAILAGYGLWSVLWVGASQLLLNTFPDWFDADGGTDRAGVLIGLLVYSVVLSVVSGRCAAAVAGGRRALAVQVLGLLLLLTGIGVQASVWTQMPIWYHVPFLVLLYPATVMGGRQRSRR